jgi:hypothetical protein
MDTITDRNQLRANLIQLELYIGAGSAEQKEFALNLIRRGKCFITYKVNNQWRFAPSRFVGYLNNNMVAHLENETKDGKVTNPVIDKILGKVSEPNELLESEYIHYCNYLGVIPNRIARRYWLFDF